MTKSTYQIEREQRMAKQAKAMKNLTDVQLQAIDSTISTLKNCVDMIRDTSDLYLSDIQAMETAYWKMYDAFNK